MEHHHAEQIWNTSWLFPFSDHWQNHGHCVLYNKYIIAFDSIGSILTGLSYMIIPMLLARVIIGMWTILPRAAKALIMHAGAFIFFCGTTHFIDVWNWWHNDYHVSAMAKVLTGFVSISFAGRIFFFIRDRGWEVPQGEG